MTSPAISELTFEHLSPGQVAGHSRPRISWRYLQSCETVKDWIQTGYEIEVTDVALRKQSHQQPSNNNVLVEWPAEPLRSRDTAVVRVRAWGKASSATSNPVATPWSDEATVEAGLLDPVDWTASLITSAVRVGEEGPLHPLRFIKSFDLTHQPTHARLYITACGVCDVYINGMAASDEQMAPDWTSYKYRHNYRTLDLGHLLRAGQNVIAIEAAEGWYCGRLGFCGGKRFWYGKDIAVLAQLEVDKVKVVGTDETWLCAPSAIIDSQIYDGETYDASIADEHWKTDGEVTEWQPTRTLPFPEAKLIAPDAPSVRVTEILEPRNIFRTPQGKVVVDFGQNMVGKILLKKLHLPKGATLTIRHAEVLENGELGIRPLREAKAMDTIIGSGHVLKEWTPRFTFHGFRYVQIDGWPTDDGMPGKTDLVALFMHSDMKRRGTFECSNASVNQLHRNVVMSMRSNFLSVPTDCPQRDERMGWTGDLQVFAPTASYLYDTVGMLGNWLEDLMAEQLSEDKGGVPGLVVPDVIPCVWRDMPQAVWDDVTVLTPHVLHQYSGDKDLLRRQLPSAQAWLDKGVIRGEDGLWSQDIWQLGDWLDPTAPPSEPGASRTDDVLVADAYLVHATQTLADICKTIDETDLAAQYSAQADRLKHRFQEKYITPAGNITSNTQTALSLAVVHDLYRSPAELRVAAQSLRKFVRRAKFRITTGFAGTPAIAHALTALLQPQLAYRMLLETQSPSWLYPVTMGATTTWERWDSMLPDGSINPGEMTSFNHYALGAVADWLHGDVGGIKAAEPGWKVVRVRPVPGGNLRWARVGFEGPYGRVECEWRLEEVGGGERLSVEVLVPPNSSARVTMPSQWKKDVGEESEEKFVVVGSGRHHFEEIWSPGEWPPTAIYQPYESAPEVDTIAA